MSQQLSSKDQSLFRQVVRHCENKQYKKGIKAAEQILRKNPNHGNTQAMKALILSHQGQQEEAFTLAKLALKNDMKSHVCWHVYGLLYRADKNFDEAIKAYKFALKIDQDNQTILRDLALLQMQMRDYQGYIQSRSLMLQNRPGFRQNWTALAIAHHLAGDLKEAENVLNTYEETLKRPPPRTDMEHSEAVLYKNTIIAESGNLEKALEHLTLVGNDCFDTLAVLEMQAGYLLSLGRKSEAATAYEALLERNAENSNYYDALILAKDIDAADHKTLKAIYDYWAEKNPGADSPRRIPLDFLEGNDFYQSSDLYLQRMLRKGVPSTFANIKGLYVDSAKRDAVQDIVEGYAAGKVDAQPNGSANDKETKPTVETLFKSSTFYFLAQHYNYHLSRDLDKAMEYVDKALELVPGSVEFQMTKARIWKHRGDPTKAAEEMEKARKLDERDRYINSKASKYLLRNNQNDEALRMMSKFTRNDTAGGALGDLHEMQCIWYLTEDAESRLRQKNLGLALKRFHAVYNIFDTWHEDQFDFHSFSLRKGTIRAYVDMVRWEDHLRDHPYYVGAVLGAVKAYVLLYDDPELAKAPGVNGTKEGGNTDSAERKKALKKAKREQQKQLEQAEALKKAADKQGITVDAGSKKPDPDPFGLELVNTAEPLKQAMKFLTPLLDLEVQNIEVLSSGFEVYIRRKKHLLALKCLLAIHAIDPSEPALRTQADRLRKDVASLPQPLPPNVFELISAELAALKL